MRLGPLPRITIFGRSVGSASHAVLVAAVEIRRERLELRRARIDALEGRHQVELESLFPHRGLAGAEDVSELLIAESGALERPQQIARHVAQADHLRRPAQLDDLGELLEEPRIDLRQLADLLDRPRLVERAEQGPHAAVVGHDQLSAKRRVLFLIDARTSRRRRCPRADRTAILRGRARASECP